MEFEYPGALDVKLDYIRPRVVLELGTHAEPIPNVVCPVAPFAARYYPQVFTGPDCPVCTVVARRTFWEKATILHAEYHRPSATPMPARYSRHYVDMGLMAESSAKDEALEDLKLILQYSADRNILVHNHGIVNESYLTLLRRNKITPSHSLGAKISIEYDYTSNALQLQRRIVQEISGAIFAQAEQLLRYYEGKFGIYP